MTQNFVRLVFVFLSKELACQGPKFHKSPSFHETFIQIFYSPLPGNSLLYTKAFGSLPPFLVLFCAVCFKASQSQSLWGLTPANEGKDTVTTCVRIKTRQTSCLVCDSPAWVLMPVFLGGAGRWGEILAELVPLWDTEMNLSLFLTIDIFKVQLKWNR